MSLDRSPRGRSFNPRVPRGTRRYRRECVFIGTTFQSTRPARDATILRRAIYGLTHVSIHASRAGRDQRLWCAPGRGCKFQSTRPARDATACSPRSPPASTCFNPRVPRGTRPGHGSACQCQHAVSIHASRAGRDDPRQRDPHLIRLFQSTRPTRDATACDHACWSTWHCFNPRVPRGTRQTPTPAKRRPKPFQSTRPARDAT